MRIVIAEDQLLYELLPDMLRRYGYAVDYAARNGDELLGQMQRLESPPDVALLDISMPPTFSDEGYRTAAAIRDRWPSVGILLYSQHVFPDIARSVLALPGEGGLGYALKDQVASSTVLRAVLDRIASGGRYLEQDLVGKLIGRARDTPVEQILSQREREVLALMAQGLSNAAIARQLGLEDKTVEGVVTAVFTKLEIPGGRDNNKRVLAILRWLDRSP